MGKIFIIMGKSATGKDTVLKHLLEDASLGLHTCILYTTRPMRVGEIDGVSYHFRDEAHLREILHQGRLIEQRSYPSMHGAWYYYMVDDGSIDLEARNYYCMVGTIDSYLSVRDYYGADAVIPILIECDSGVLLQRALKRELKQESPKYSEMCRRFLADEQDFSEGRKALAQITEAFENTDIDECVHQIREKILQSKSS